MVAGRVGAADRRRVRIHARCSRSALFEIANIGSGNAATALSEMLGRPVDISYPDATLVTVAEAADKIGSSVTASAVVETGSARRCRAACC